MPRDVVLGDRIWPVLLDVPGIEELERTVDRGLWLIHARIAEGHCSTEEVRLVLRLGLQGAGAAPEDATVAATEYCRPPYLEQMRVQALLIVQDAIGGGKGEIAEWEAPGKEPAGRSASPGSHRSPTGGSTSPSSTDTPPQSDGSPPSEASVSETSGASSKDTPPSPRPPKSRRRKKMPATRKPS